MFKVKHFVKIKSPNKTEVDRILNNAFKRDLTLTEIKKLLFSSKKFWGNIIECANEIKRLFFDKYIYFYVPIYIDSYCVNDCLYCDFRHSNLKCFRKSLNFGEFKKELDYLNKQGYSKIELVSSTDLTFSTQKLARFIKYTKSCGKAWVLLNNQPLTYREYKHLKKVGLDWGWLWMETYNQEFYTKYHPQGTEKNSFEKRLKSYDAMGKAKLNIGLAFLMGLAPNWRLEIFNTIAHAKYLKSKYNIKIEFGTPRFCPPKYAPLKKVPFPKTIIDDKFRLMVALYRLAVRKCWINVSTREDIKMLEQLWQGGANLTNPEAQTIPGGYCLKAKGAQFKHYSYTVDFFKRRIERLGLKAIN